MTKTVLVYGPWFLLPVQASGLAELLTLWRNKAAGCFYIAIRKQR